MPHWELTWQLAAILAACLFSMAGIARLLHRPRLGSAVPFTREAGLVVGLYALWQYAGAFSLMGTDDALARAQWIWRAERAWHLPSEAAVQHLVLPYPLIVEAFNVYYATMHFTVLIVFLVWLFTRHRHAYGQIRTVLAAFTAASLLIQLVPVAPPRLLTGIGLVDTARAYGQSVYATGIADQYSAMPSVHVGWAMLIAFTVWRLGSRRVRWLGVAHAALTWIVVTATANHFWLDGIVACTLLAVVTGLLMAVSTTARRLRPVTARLVTAAGWPRAQARGPATVKPDTVAGPGMAVGPDTASLVTAAPGDAAPGETAADKLGPSADVRSMGVR